MPNIKSEKELKLRIGDIVISVASYGSNFLASANYAYKCFITSHEPEVVLHVYYDQIPKCKSERKIFDTGTIWSMSQSNGKYILKDSTRIAILEPDFKSGRIYIKKSRRKTPFPLSYPLDEVIMINLLAKGRGVMIHSCGIKNGGKGILFVGASGAGKSTMANLWKDKKDVNVLSDDRIIIRRKNGRFWIYGTPWHGDAKVSSPEKAPLEKIFFLKHAKRNSLRKIGPVEATYRLIICSFPTFWDKKGMKFTLKFCAELAQEIPCYELGFVPDESILDFIEAVR